MPVPQEKTPSFSVSPEKGVWHCFGCQKSGDAITFVREVEHLDFVEAVERLAGARQHHAALRRRVVLGGTQAQAAAARSGAGRDRLLPPACCSSRPTAGIARRYLRSRGFDGDAVRQFSLGWSPDGYDALSAHLQKAKFSRQDIVDAGLAFVNRANKLQDAFRGRLMFPIWDTRGDPVGFGGRTLDRRRPEVQEHRRDARSTTSRGCSTG